MENQKKYSLEKDKKHKLLGRLKVRVGSVIMIVSLAVGSVAIYNIKTKRDRTKEIASTSFEQTLSKRKDETCFDEVIGEYTIQYINTLERQIQASNKINNLNLEKYDLKAIDESYEDVQIDEIESDLSKLDKMLKKIDEGKIDLSVPTKETTEFYTLANKIKNQDSKSCNKYITSSYGKIECLYYDIIASLFLDYCGLDESYRDNIKYSVGEYNILKTEDEEAEFVTPGDDNVYLTYNDPKNDKTYTYQVANSIVDKTYYNLDKDIIALEDEYNKDRNKIILDALTKIKEMLYYNVSIQHRLIGNREVMSGKFSQDKYQKVKK